MLDSNKNKKLKRSQKFRFEVVGDIIGFNEVDLSKMIVNNEDPNYPSHFTADETPDDMYSRFPTSGVDR